MSELKQAINEMRNMRESYDQLVSQNAQLASDVQAIKDAHILEFNTGGVVWTHPEAITPFKLLLYKDTITHLVDDSIEELVDAPQIIIGSLEYLELKKLSLLRNSITNGFFSGDSIKAEVVKMPSLNTFGGGAGGISNNTHIKELYFDIAEIIKVWLGFAGYSELRKVYMPKLTLTYNGLYSLFAGCPVLIDIVCGENFLTNQFLDSWSPSIALENNSSSLVGEGESFANNLEKLLYNIREHIAANLPTITAGYSITFSAAVKAAILADQETADAFTNKGWTIA